MNPRQSPAEGHADAGVQAMLAEAVTRADEGSLDADLGGGLIKQRIARAGGGRSGGYRTIIAYRTKDRAIFLYGFAKNERDNVDVDDLADLKKAAWEFLRFSEAQINHAAETGKLIEVKNEKKIS